ncbi:MAG: fibronectin type III domain-containing protein [Verrucomicrobiota bacterium]|nr:fibronectin type III domain-containing protein [Verrucomicrobiota bacterium]
MNPINTTQILRPIILAMIGLIGLAAPTIHGQHYVPKSIGPDEAPRAMHGAGAAILDWFQDDPYYRSFAENTKTVLGGAWAQDSLYPNTPLIFWGHSAGGPVAYNAAVSDKYINRAVAVIVNHSSFTGSNVVSTNPRAEIAVFWENAGRDSPNHERNLTSAKNMAANGWAVTFVIGKGESHGATDPEKMRLYSLWMEEVVNLKVPQTVPVDGPAQLMPIDETQGWVGFCTAKTRASGGYLNTETEYYLDDVQIYPYAERAKGTGGYIWLPSERVAKAWKNYALTSSIDGDAAPRTQFRPILVLWDGESSQSNISGTSLTVVNFPNFNHDYTNVTFTALSGLPDWMHLSSHGVITTEASQAKITPGVFNARIQATYENTTIAGNWAFGIRADIRGQVDVEVAVTAPAWNSVVIAQPFDLKWSSNEPLGLIKCISGKDGELVDPLVGDLGKTGTIPLDGLSPGTHIITLWTYSQAPTTSRASATVKIFIPEPTTEAPVTPVNLLSSSNVIRQIQLNWTNPATSNSGFAIERKLLENGSYEQIATVNGDISTYVDKALTPGTAYTYRIRAFNSQGFSGYSGETTSTTPLVAPEVPVDLVTASTSPTTIHLTWSDPSDFEDGFKIERAFGAGNFTELTTVPANTTSYTDTALAAYTDYTYRLRAYRDTANSGYSDTATIKTLSNSPTSPPSPTTLQALAQSAVTVHLTWVDNATTEDGFLIERKDGSGAFLEVGRVMYNQTSFTDTKLMPRTTYTYRVAAYNTAGTSTASDSVAVNTERGGATRILEELFDYGAKSGNDIAANSNNVYTSIGDGCSYRWRLAFPGMSPVGLAARLNSRDGIARYIDNSESYESGKVYYVSALFSIATQSTAGNGNMAAVMLNTNGTVGTNGLSFGIGKVIDGALTVRAFISHQNLDEINMLNPDVYQSSMQIKNNTVYLLIAKFEVIDSDANLGRLSLGVWDSAIPDAEPTVWNAVDGVINKYSAALDGQNPLNRMVIYQGSVLGVNDMVDDIRIGTNFYDVLPSPYYSIFDLSKIVDGWRASPWGQLYDAKFPWVYSPHLGWFWVSGDTEENFFFYLWDTHEWGWSTIAIAPWYYNFGSESAEAGWKLTNQ